MSGGDSPTLFASHHAPRRAGSTSLCPPQLRRSGENEIQMCAPESRHRAMEQREAAVDAARQQRRILVVGLHDQAVPLERAEVLGQRQRDAGPSLLNAV